MAGKSKFNVQGKVVTSPRGKLMWVYINKVNDYGNLEAKLHLSPEESQKFEAELQPMLDAAYEEEVARNKNPDSVIKADLNKGTDDEGNVIYKFKNPEFDSQGNPTLIKVFNVKGEREQELGDNIGNGSVGKVKAFVYPYYMATSKTVGISMRMNALQVIEQVEFSSGDFDDESGEEVTDEEF